VVYFSMMEGRIKSQQKYPSIIYGISPVSAVGVLLLLGSTLLSAAASRTVDPRSQPAIQQAVSERLAAIREAVFVAEGSGLTGRHRDPNVQLAWGNQWGRHRSGRQPWINWRGARPSWSNFWRNW
jgi:hypothetical protein